MSKSYIVTLQCDYEVEVEADSELEAERKVMDNFGGYKECIVLDIEECEG